MSQALHEAHGATLSIRFAIITCSDTRSREEDTSGAFILDCLRQAGHELLSYQIVKDEPALIQGEVRSLVAKKADALCKISTSSESRLLSLRRRTNSAASAF